MKRLEIDKDFLETQYVDRQKMPWEIGAYLGISDPTVRVKIKEHSIPMRTLVESMAIMRLRRKEGNMPMTYPDAKAQIEKEIANDGN